MKKDMDAKSIPSLRSVNRPGSALVLGFILEKDPMSARYISDHLRLSKSTVSNILQTLVSDEIVYPTKDAPEKYGITKANLEQALKLLDPVSDGGHSSKPKQKLTLALSKAVIERAKDLGINISAITEEFLKAVTYEYYSLARHNIHQAYLHLFEAIKPVVDSYKLDVEVGRTASTNNSRPLTYVPLFLSYRAQPPALWTTIWRDQRTRWTFSAVGPEINNLYSPRVVLENLIEAVINTNLKDKLKLQELEISLKLARAILSPAEV